MKSSICYMTAENFARLKKDMAAMQKEDGDGGQDVSANDMLLALFWRALMKARVQAAHAAPYEPGYVGNVVLINQIYMPVAELTHPSTTLRHVAQRVRQGARKFSQTSAQDAYTLAREVTDYTALKHAFTSLEGSAMMITSLVALLFSDFDFGGLLFGNGGKPDNLRPLMGGFNRAFRLCVVLPWKPHGALELLVSLFEDKMDVLMKDKEFTRYASFFCH
jgi:hypothetical protein